MGGDHGQLGGPQAGVHLAGPVDPVVAGLGAAELAGEADQDDDAVAVRLPLAGPGVGGYQPAADHVGVEEVEAGLEVAGGVNRVVRNGGGRSHRPVALLVEQVQVEPVGGRSRSGAGFLAFRRPGRQPTGVQVHRTGVGCSEAGQALQRVRPQMDRTLAMREQPHLRLSLETGSARIP